MSISRSLDIGIGYRQQWLLKHVSSVSIFKRFGMFGITYGSLDIIAKLVGVQSSENMKK